MMQNKQGVSDVQHRKAIQRSAFSISYSALCSAHYALCIGDVRRVRAAEVAHFVEYIETDGAGSTAGEYVLLEYKPTAQSVVEMDFVPLDLSVNNALFCARGAYVTYRPFTLIWYAGSGLRWDYNR